MLNKCGGGDPASTRSVVPARALERTQQPPIPILTQEGRGGLPLHCVAAVGRPDAASEPELDEGGIGSGTFRRGPLPTMGMLSG